MELGVIQDIKILEEGSGGEEMIWFFQGLKGLVRNINLKKIIKRKFEISDVLIKEGYQIRDPKQFDRNFRHCCLTHLPMNLMNLTQLK